MVGSFRRYDKDRRYEPRLEDLRRALLCFRFDPRYKGRDNRVPLASFAEFVGLSRQTLYQLMNRSNMFAFTADCRSRINYGITMVCEQGLRWRRRHGHWQAFLPDGAVPVKPQKKLPASKERRWSGDRTLA